MIRLIFSLILAFVVWGFIVWETNPERTRIERDVPVDVVNLAPNMRVVDEIPTVTITMKGPEDVINGITSAMVSASVDLGDVNSPGVIERQIEAKVPDGLREVTIEPDTVELEIDEIISRTLSIDLLEPETRPANVADVSVTGRLAVVSGSRSAVTKVASVAARVDIQGRTESFTEDVPLVALDSEGNQVSGVRIEPETVEVSVAFSTTERFVPVTVICRCVEDGQLEIREFPEAAAIPSTVQVNGPEGVVSELDAIPTEPIDLSGLRESGWKLDVQLDRSQLPPDIELGETTVDVWVPIERQRIDFEDVPIRVINLEDGFEANLSDRTASLTIRGSEPALEQLEGNPPTVVVNAIGRSAGTYVLEVQVVLPPEVTYDELSPNQVQLIIERETVPEQFDLVPPTDGLTTSVTAS